MYCVATASQTSAKPEQPKIIRVLVLLTKISID
jgi:hypothetical protein